MTQRSLLADRVEDRPGNGIQNAKVFVYELGTTTPVADLFSAMTGGSPVGFLLSGEDGYVEGWVTTSRYFTLHITDNGGTMYYPQNPDVPLSGTAFDKVRGAFLVSDVY